MFDIQKHTIFLTVTGSRLYGTNRPNSDIDIRGVIIPPEEYFFSATKRFEQYELKREDLTLWEIRKFLNLCVKNNPNILELLFIPERFWRKSTAYWEKIVENRELFLSQRIRHTFSGYAYAQLNRIKIHRKWLLDPKEEKPKREDFNLPPNPEFNKEIMNTILTIPPKIVISDKRQMLVREQNYFREKLDYDKYQNWKKTRNLDRAKLEERYGFDGKHALHLFRLFYEAEELFTKKTLTFPRPEKDELLDVLAGKYKYDEVIEFCDKMIDKLDNLVDKSDLPRSPDIEKIDKLCTEVIKEFLAKGE